MRGLSASLRSVAPWTVLFALLATPVLVLGTWWLVAHADNPTAAAARVDPVSVAVTHADVRPETSTGVKLVDAPGRELLATGAGTVTDAPGVGGRVANGDVVFKVDDRPIRAMVAAAPQWRQLASGDHGSDVGRLQKYLADIGYDAGPPDGKFGDRLRHAVERFNIDAGRGIAGSTFDPATVIWIGPEPLTIAESLVGEGATLTPGLAVARGPARPGSVVVDEPQGGIAGLGDFGGTATLSVGKTSVGYVPGSGVITLAADVAALREALTPATEGVARITADTARRVAIVPASALVTGADGTMCVYPSASGVPEVVTPIGGGVASAQLPDDFPLREVLSNPGRVRLDHKCGL